MKMVIPNLVLVIATYILFILVQAIGLNPYAGALLFAAAFAIACKIIFGLFEEPRPSELTTEEIKSFLKSKIFWLAVLNLFAVALRELLGFDLDNATQEEILSLDWDNGLQALASIAIIAIRKFDVLKFLV